MIAFLNWLDGVLWGVPLIALMILTGLYFTVRSGFFQFRHFQSAIIGDHRKFGFGKGFVECTDDVSLLFAIQR